MPDGVNDPGVYPPQPERGRIGEEGELGTTDGLGGAGGTGGRGGRGGIGAQGDVGPRGSRGPIGPSGGKQGKQGEQGRRGAQGEPGEFVDPQPRWMKIAIFISVLTAVFGAGFVAVTSTQNIRDANARLSQVEMAQAELDDDQADFDRQIECQHEVLTTTLEGLKARSAFAEQQATVTLAGDKAQRAYILALSDSQPDPQDGAQLTEDYLVALGFKIQATAEQLRIRVNNPYPSVGQIAACGG